MDFITYLINGIIGGVVTIKIGEKLLNKKAKINLNKIIGIVFYSMILTLNYMIVDNFLKVILIFLANIMLNTIVFKDRIEKSIIVSFIEYVNILLSECIVGLTLTVLTSKISLLSNIDIEIIKNSIMLNIFIIGFSYILVLILERKYKKIVDKTEDNSILLLSLIAVIILICLGSLFYRFEISNRILNSSFVLNTLIIFIMIFVGFMVIAQRLEYDRKSKEYINLAKYSEINSTLLEEYSVLNHEHKNQLIIIKGMIADKDKDVEKYVNSLIDKKKNIKFKWIRELNNIKFQGLKSFINYKILEMKTEKIEVTVRVSEACKDIELEKISRNKKEKLYSIMGVYLDNAREAAIISKDKKVSIDTYVIEDKICFEIANTYNDKINLNMINEYGYTSKGTGHGTGLYIIQNMIKNDFSFETITKIEKGFFIQIIKLKI